MGSNMQRQAVPLLRAEAPLRRHRHGGHHGPRLGRGGRRPARRHRRLRRLERIIVRVEERDGETVDGEIGADIYTLTKFKRSNQNTCINQKPIVARAAEGPEGPGPRRRPLHRAGRAGARPQRAGRLHAVARLQLRGRDPGLREAGEGGLLHLDPHRGVRDRGPRHQARARGDHARHPERRRRRSCATSTRAASSASAPTSSRATSWSARSRRRARPSSRRRRSCCARSSARRPATCATPRSTARRASRASSSTSRSSPARASTRTIAPRRSRAEELEKMEKNLQDEIRILARRSEEADRRTSSTGRRCAADLARRARPRARPAQKGDGADAEMLDAADHVRVAGPRARSRPTMPRLDDDPATTSKIATAARSRCSSAISRRKEKAEARRRAAAGRHQAGQGLRRHEAQAVGRRQDGRPARQQGRHRAHPARGGHAVPARRDAGRDRPQPAGRALAHERRPDSRDPPRLGGACARPHFATPVFDGATEAEIKTWLDEGGPAEVAARRGSSTA